jgi:hypothetical protein
MTDREASQPSLYGCGVHNQSRDSVVCHCELSHFARKLSTAVALTVEFDQVAEFTTSPAFEPLLKILDISHLSSIKSCPFLPETAFQ